MRIGQQSMSQQIKTRDAEMLLYKPCLVDLGGYYGGEGMSARLSSGKIGSGSSHGQIQSPVKM